MELKEAQQKFIETWGNLGSSWGINRSVAQVQALLLITPEPISTDDIMDQLQISRGNVNMSLRQLMDFGVVFKKSIPGERKEYFVSEKDIWKWAPKIMTVRKQRELNPILEVLTELKEVRNTDQTDEGATFIQQIKELEYFSNKVSKVADRLCSSKGDMLLKLFKLFA